MTTLNNLILIFQDIAKRHNQINDFECSQDFNIATDEEPTYPIIVVNPTGANLPKTDAGYTSFSTTFDFQCIDLVSKDNSNRNDVLSDTMQIINDCVSELSQHPYYTENSIDLIGNVSFEPLRGKYDEDVDGWKISLELQTPNKVSWCGAPMETLNGFTPPSSLDATVENSTASFRVEVPAGTTKVLDDEQLQLVDVSGDLIQAYSNPLYEDLLIEVPVFEEAEKLDFIITVDTTISDVSPSDSVEFRVDKCNCKIDFGDGTKENYFNISGSLAVSHQYSSGGVYDIKIRGFCIFRNNLTTSDQKKIIAVKQWDSIVHTNFMFRNNINISSFPQNETFFTQENCQGMFQSNSAVNFGKIDVSRVTITSNMFQSSNFDYDIGYWNVARVTNMSNMFLGTSMSQANCDAIFTGWTRWNSTTSTAGITLKSNVSIHMGNTDYTRGGDAEDAFNYLVNTLNWTITFG